MPLPPLNTAVDGDVMREQLDYLIMIKAEHVARGCSCRACWMYDRTREILMMPHGWDYYDVRHHLKKLSKKAGGA